MEKKARIAKDFLVILHRDTNQQFAQEKASETTKFITIQGTWLGIKQETRRWQV
jgi:acyl-ACP thioesterase